MREIQENKHNGNFFVYIDSYLHKFHYMTYNTSSHRMHSIPHKCKNLYVTFCFLDEGFDGSNGRNKIYVLSTTFKTN